MRNWYDVLYGHSAIMGLITSGKYNSTGRSRKKKDY
jgi:hypothetical protein